MSNTTVLEDFWVLEGMGKKKLTAPTAVVTVPVFDAETISRTNRERNRKTAEAEWDKTLTVASGDYSAAMEGAWRKYVIALKADPTKPGDALWGKERDYDKEYDRDRQIALGKWNRTTQAASEKLERAEAE